MNTLYKSIDQAVLKAVANLYSLLIRQDVTASYPVAKRRGYSRYNKITLSGSPARLPARHRSGGWSGGKINGAKVPWHVYKAIAERIKYNANLHNKKSGQSQIILNISGKKKVLKVNLSSNGVLKLFVINS